MSKAPAHINLPAPALLSSAQEMPVAVKQALPHIRLEMADGLTDAQKRGMIRLRQQFNTCAGNAGVNVEMMGSHRSAAKPFKMHGADGKFLFNADPDATLSAQRQHIDLEGVMYEQLAHARSGNFDLLNRTSRLYEILQTYKKIEPVWQRHPQATSDLIVRAFGSIKEFQKQAERIKDFYVDYNRAKDLAESQLQIDITHPPQSSLVLSPRTVMGSRDMDMVNQFAALVEKQVAKKDLDKATPEERAEYQKQVDEHNKVLAIKNYLKNSLPPPDELRAFSDKLIQVEASLSRTEKIQYTNPAAQRQMRPEQMAAHAPMATVYERNRNADSIEDMIKMLHYAETFAADAYATRTASNPRALIDYLERGKKLIGTTVPHSFPDSELKPSDAERIKRMEAIIATEKLTANPISFAGRYSEKKGDVVATQR